MLLLAASDTTGSTITRVVDLLAHHQDIQAKLREEIAAATKGAGRELSQFSHEDYGSLRYLDAIIRESLRM